jgi:pentatricopeptide repeat protein
MCDGRNILLGTALVDMYSKCGELDEARELLQCLIDRDVIAWSALLSGYAKQGATNEALECFARMHCESISPNGVTFISILNACGRSSALEIGKRIHGVIMSQGMSKAERGLGNALVDMYAKCGDFARAEQVLLEELPTPSIIAWNALITGYVQQCQYRKALECSKHMQRHGISGNTITFICILKACGMEKVMAMGELIHDEIMNHGWIKKDIVLGTALVDMYAKCDMFVKANKVLDELLVRDVVSWSALIAGYAQKRQGHNALKCFERMQREGCCHPNVVTYVCILNACGNSGALSKGESIHEEIIRTGLLKHDEIILGNTLVDMYAKCSMLKKAQQVLDGLPSRDLISWNTLISGFAQHGQAYNALESFEQMRSEGFVPDQVSFLCILSACSHSGLSSEALIYFESMVRNFSFIPDLEHHICMVMAFGSNGCFDNAISVIEAMLSSCNNPRSWLALLGACKKWGNVKLGRLAFDRVVQCR